MGLDEQAKYYEGKLHKHSVHSKVYSQNSDTNWEYEGRHAADSDEFNDEDRRRKNFEEMRMVKDAAPPGLEWDFDRDHALWPRRRTP